MGFSKAMREEKKKKLCPKEHREGAKPFFAN